MLISKRKLWETLFALAIFGILFATSSPLLGAPVPGGPGFVSVGIYAFKPNSQTTSFLYSGGRLMNMGDQSADFVAPVHLPHGATITQTILYFTDNGTSDISFGLWVSSLDASVSPIVMAQMTTSGASTLKQALVGNVFSNGNIMDNQSNYYSIIVKLPPGPQYQLFGVRIDYNYPVTLPLIMK